MILYDACRALFGMTDLLRRAQGQSFQDFGLGPEECPYEVVASGAFWRHRDYGKSSSQSVLIVAAPIKRAYVWDLPYRALSATFCVRASMSISWNGFQPRQRASMVWQNTPRAFPNVLQGFHAGIQVQRPF